MTYRMRRCDGVFRWHTVRALPVRGRNGRVVKWIGTTDELDHAEPAPRPNDRIAHETEVLQTLLDTVQPAVLEGRGGVEPGAPPARADSRDYLERAGPDIRGIEISLLGAFGVQAGGEPIEGLSAGSQRLLAYLALHDRVVTRVAMAGTMWPEASDHRAGVSLRSALSRMDGRARDAIVVTSAGLRLATSVTVDLRDAQAVAQRLLQPEGTSRESDLSSAAVSALSAELLPDWYDDWVLAETDDWRQLRLHALEAQARSLTASGHLARAAVAARAAVRVEPLRESAHAHLVRVHLAEGNQSEALRIFDRYRDLLFRELGLEPTPHLSELLTDIREK